MSAALHEEGDHQGVFVGCDLAVRLIWHVLSLTKAAASRALMKWN